MTNPYDIQNIRQSRVDDTDLRESLKAAGWNPNLPAIKDEHGVVLVGNRRLRLAAELGVTPVIKDVTFGDGPAADLERTRLAAVSNTGGAPLSKEDRKALAIRMYDGGNGVTMQAIADTLGVSQPTITRDLQGFIHVNKPSRPKGGRPKSAAKKTGPKPSQHKYDDTTRQAAAKMNLDQGMAVEKVADALGVSEQVVIKSVQYEAGRRAATAEAAADPEVRYEDLPKTSKEKVAAAIRQIKKKLEDKFEDEHIRKMSEYFNKSYIPGLREQLKRAEDIEKSHKGVFTPNEFKAIWACLHPDSRKAATEKRFNEAFRVFAHHKKVLVKEEPVMKHPPPPALPETFEELIALREKVRAERAAARAAKKNSAGTVSTQGGG